MKKLHQPLFYLLILFLPTQLGKHFWPDWAMVRGIKVDYLSPTIYFTDILALGILASWGASVALKIKNQKVCFAKLLRSVNIKIADQNVKRLILLFSFFILNVFLAQNKAVAFFKFLKILELALLGIYVKDNLTTSEKNTSKVSADFTLEVKELITILSIAIIYSSLIAWAQFLKQASLGGFLWWLGERTFVSSTPGIAQVVLNGRLFLRPYATFPHPNVLGGYIAVALPLIISNIKNQISKLKKTLCWLAVFLGIGALFISFSRAAWIVGGLGVSAAVLLSCFKPSKKGPRKRSYLLLYCSIALLLIVFLFLGKERLFDLTPEVESIKLRQELNQVAILMIKKYPLTGVGLNNFMPSLPQFKKGLSYQELQPAHNIYLLIGAETGLVGLGAFSWLIFKAYQKLISNDQFLISNQIPNPDFLPAEPAGRKLATQSRQSQILGQLGIRSIRNFVPITFSPLFVSLTSILLLGLVDHYFYTLQQGSLLFAIVLGAVFAVE